MRSTTCNFLLGASCLLAVMLTALSSAAGQALTTASRSMDIAAFGGYSLARTDYAGYKDQGGAFGVDVSRFFHVPIVPSLEARANVVTGTAIDQKTYLFGVRAEVPVHRLHPYGDFLVGVGTLHFKYAPSPGYTGDRSTVYSYGGGIDVDLFKNLQLKVDAQYQKWNLGPNGNPVQPGANTTLAPLIGIVGVEYHIPFRPHDRQRDFYR